MLVKHIKKSVWKKIHTIISITNFYVQNMCVFAAKEIQCTCLQL